MNYAYVITAFRLEVETLDYAEVAQFAVLECTGKHALGIISRYSQLLHVQSYNSLFD